MKRLNIHIRNEYNLEKAIESINQHNLTNIFKSFNDQSGIHRNINISLIGKGCTNELFDKFVKCVIDHNISFSKLEFISTRISEFWNIRNALTHLNKNRMLGNSFKLEFINHIINMRQISSITNIENLYVDLCLSDVKIDCSGLKNMRNTTSIIIRNSELLNDPIPIKAFDKLKCININDIKYFDLRQLDKHTNKLIRMNYKFVDNHLFEIYIEEKNLKISNNNIYYLLISMENIRNIFKSQYSFNEYISKPDKLFSSNEVNKNKLRWKSNFLKIHDINLFENTFPIKYSYINDYRVKILSQYI